MVFHCFFKETTPAFGHAKAGKCPKFCLSTLAALCREFDSCCLCKSRFSIIRLLVFWKWEARSVWQSWFYLSALSASTLWINRVQSASPSVQRHKGLLLKRIFWIPCVWPRIWWIVRRQSYSLSSAGVYLSYLSCPAWWTKCISHEMHTLTTN